MSSNFKVLTLPELRKDHHIFHAIGMEPSGVFAIKMFNFEGMEQIKSKITIGKCMTAPNFQMGTSDYGSYWKFSQKTQVI